MVTMKVVMLIAGQVNTASLYAATSAKALVLLQVNDSSGCLQSLQWYLTQQQIIMSTRRESTVTPATVSMTKLWSPKGIGGCSV